MQARIDHLTNLIAKYEALSASYRAMINGRPGPEKLFTERIVELAYRKLEAICH